MIVFRSSYSFLYLNALTSITGEIRSLSVADYLNVFHFIGWCLLPGVYMEIIAAVTLVDEDAENEKPSESRSKRLRPENKTLKEL